MINYREAPPTHEVLDLTCHRCGLHGLYQAYLLQPNKDNILCRECCIIERGAYAETSYSVITTYAVISADGLAAFPKPYPSQDPWSTFLLPKSYFKKILVPGEKPTESPWL